MYLPKDKIFYIICVYLNIYCYQDIAQLVNRSYERYLNSFFLGNEIGRFYSKKTTFLRGSINNKILVKYSKSGKSENYNTKNTVVQFSNPISFIFVLCSTIHKRNCAIPS